MINVKTDLWDYLRSASKPIVMYGMGNGADKILNICEKKGIVVSDFFASDGFVRGHSFHGKVVLSYSAVKEKYGNGNFIILLSFASSLSEVIENIKRIAAENELYAPDVPVNGNELFDMEFYLNNKDKIEKVRSLFADEQSIRVFDNVINYKLSGDIRYFDDIETDAGEAYNNVLRASGFEITADLGAYNGDTARELAVYSPSLKEIYAFEPDRRNFRKLSEYAEREERFKVTPFNLAAWSKSETLTFGAEGNRNSGVGQTLVNGKTAKFTEVSADSLDNVLRSVSPERLDYIKFDVEGAEKEALEGCYQAIERYSPALLISAYHRSKDIFALPLQISEKFPDYKLYLRKFRYIPAWDLNLYCVK